jgi:hypothetical protein
MFCSVAEEGLSHPRGDGGRLGAGARKEETLR